MRVTATDIINAIQDPFVLTRDEIKQVKMQILIRSELTPDEVVGNLPPRDYLTTIQRLAAACEEFVDDGLTESLPCNDVPIGRRG